MSYKLEYPYTEDERLEFIIEYNHNQGLKIETVDNFVEEEKTKEITEEQDVLDEEGNIIGTEIVVVDTEVYYETTNYPTHYALETNEIMVDNEPVVDSDYEAKQEQKERERIQELFMTRSDFFDGTIDAWGVGEDELLFLVQCMLVDLPLEDKQKLKAINNFKNALNFYRKHDLFKMLIGIPIQLTEFTQVIITEEGLDKYFDEVNKGNKATAWQYLPQPTAIPSEPVVAERPIEESSYDDI